MGVPMRRPCLRRARPAMIVTRNVRALPHLLKDNAGEKLRCLEGGFFLCLFKLISLLPVADLLAAVVNRPPCACPATPPPRYNSWWFCCPHPAAKHATNNDPNPTADKAYGFNDCCEWPPCAAHACARPCLHCGHSLLAAVGRQPRDPACGTAAPGTCCLRGRLDACMRLRGSASRWPSTATGLFCGRALCG